MRLLQAGPFNLKYENGFLRYISYGNDEIIRMVYFALRDDNWGTVDVVVQEEKIITDQNSFIITYNAYNQIGDEKVFHWKSKIEGKTDGTISFEISGSALKDFKKNRAGFCVLHPLKDYLNTTCEIIHPDNSVTKRNFPTHIDSDNPFKRIKTFRWAMKENWFTLHYKGDVFETEDQRNWSDASFKTFCTPLDRPFPVLLKQGEQVYQKIIFSPKAVLPSFGSPSSDVILRETNKQFRIPYIGIGASTEVTALTNKSIALLHELNLHHYRVEVYPFKEGWVTSFSKDCEHAAALALPLEVALHLSNNFREESEAFIQLCLQNRLSLSKILLLSKDADVTSAEVVEIIPYLKSQLPMVAFGAGTNFNFTEINKNRFGNIDFDFLSYSLNPQEHAFDDSTLIENLEAQNHTVRSVKAMYRESISVHISPVTLRKRFNPYTTNPLERIKSNIDKADPRQKTPFAAVWTLGSICALASAGAEIVTYFQTVGNQGIINDEKTYPVYAVFKMLSKFHGS
jgi:hypothetical protein